MHGEAPMVPRSELLQYNLNWTGKKACSELAEPKAGGYFYKIVILQSGKMGIFAFCRTVEF